MQTVDLSSLQSEIKTRAQFLDIAAVRFAQSANFDPNEIVLRRDQIPFISPAYFILNGAFKQRRGLENTNTEPPKIAALTAAVIMSVLPFRATFPDDVRLAKSFVANQFFSFDIAARQLKSDFAALSPDMRDRAYRFLEALEVGCLDAYFEDVRNGRQQAAYTVDIEPDLPKLESLILIFELLWHAQRVDDTLSASAQKIARLNEIVAGLRAQLGGTP